MDMEQSDDSLFAVSLDDFLQNFRCTIINHVSGADENIPSKSCSAEIDFAANEDSERNFQLVQLNLMLPRDIDLSTDALSISIN